jgi:hypothetical protein
MNVDTAYFNFNLGPMDFAYETTDEPERLPTPDLNMNGESLTFNHTEAAFDAPRDVDFLDAANGFDISDQLPSFSTDQHQPRGSAALHTLIASVQQRPVWDPVAEQALFERAVETSYEKMEATDYDNEYDGGDNNGDDRDQEFEAFAATDPHCIAFKKAGDCNRMMHSVARGEMEILPEGHQFAGQPNPWHQYRLAASQEIATAVPRAARTARIVHPMQQPAPGAAATNGTTQPTAALPTLTVIVNNPVLVQGQVFCHDNRKLHSRGSTASFFGRAGLTSTRRPRRLRTGVNSMSRADQACCGLESAP